MKEDENLWCRSFGQNVFFNLFMDNNTFGVDLCIIFSTFFVVRMKYRCTI